MINELILMIILSRHGYYLGYYALLRLRRQRYIETEIRNVLSRYTTVNKYAAQTVKFGLRPRAEIFVRFSARAFTRFV